MENRPVSLVALSEQGDIVHLKGYVKGISWFEAKISIVRDAVRAYLKKPIYTLEPIILYATA